jgi:hypothetical protein
VGAAPVTWVDTGPNEVEGAPPSDRDVGTTFWGAVMGGGLGLAIAVGLGLAFGEGLGLAFGEGLGLGLGDGLGLGFGVGLGLGLGEATTAGDAGRLS